MHPHATICTLGHVRTVAIVAIVATKFLVIHPWTAAEGEINIHHNQEVLTCRPQEDLQRASCHLLQMGVGALTKLAWR